MTPLLRSCSEAARMARCGARSSGIEASPETITPSGARSAARLDSVPRLDRREGPAHERAMLTDWLCGLPTTLATLIAVFGAGLLSAGGLMVVHPMIPHRMRSQHNDIAGFVLAIVGVIYAVLL